MSDGADYNTTCQPRGTRAGCGRAIVMSQRSGKWAPYETDGTFHNCPSRTVEPQAQVTTSGQTVQEVQQQIQQGNKVPRTSMSLTRCFESPDLLAVCAQHQNFVNQARDYGATIYGSSYHFDEGKGVYTMVVWLDIPKNNVTQLTL